jgi:hypothetical protein
MSDVGKYRTYHDLVERFQVTPEHLANLESQLQDKETLARFRSGFQVEGWFQSVFCALPWTDLVHSLDQEQFPSQSKGEFQVPDYLAIVETSELVQRPILVEVKRRQGRKQSLRVRTSQFDLTQKYAERIGLPLVYATYWDVYDCWTVNTPDTFEDKGASKKLTLLSAVERDCSLIFGDVTMLLLDPMHRVQVWDKSLESDCAVHHVDYGILVEDTVTYRGETFTLNPVETAALDSAASWKDVQLSRSGERTEVQRLREGPEAIRLSTWITRNLAMYRRLPSEQDAHFSASVVCDLRERLKLAQHDIFPWDESGELGALQEAFLTTKKGDAHPRSEPAGLPTTEDEQIVFWHNAGNEILRRINETAQTGDVAKATFCLLGRIVQTGNSITHLYRTAQHDWKWDGAALLRIIYETSIQALYILNDPTQRDALARRFLDFEWVEREKGIRLIDQRQTDMAIRLADSPKRAAVEPQIRQEYARVAAVYGFDSRKKLPDQWYDGGLKSLADAVGYKTEYEFIYPQLCGATHSSYFAIRSNLPYTPFHFAHMAQLFSFRVVAKLAEYVGISLDTVERGLVEIARATPLNKRNT